MAWVLAPAGLGASVGRVELGPLNLWELDHQPEEIKRGKVVKPERPPHVMVGWSFGNMVTDDPDDLRLMANALGTMADWLDGAV